MKKQMGMIIVFLAMAAVQLVLLNSNVWSSQEKPIKLLFAAFDPEPQFGPVMKGWARDLERRTNGRVKVEISWSSALGRPHDYYDFVKKGMCDVGQVSPGFTPGAFPMTDIVSLPFVVPTAEIGVKAIMEFAKKGYLDKEFNDVKVMLFFTGMGDTIFTTKKEINTLADIKGLKIITVLPPQQLRIKIMGGTPIGLGNPMDLYPMLQKKIAEGLMLNYPMITPFKLQEVLKYSIEPGIGTGMLAILMNKQYYQKLPADIQAILAEMSEEHSLNFGTLLDKRAEFSKDLLIKAGGKINQWSFQDMAELGEMYGDIWNTWIENMTKKGLPARQAVDDLYFILEGLGVENPAIGYKPKK